ncbi:DHH family phosphoesterase [Candidatus Bathyarchaeota archaeon]|nr:DHH family phosphoesterase [Candidatus Bathyarchaeota archaeon]
MSAKDLKSIFERVNPKYVLLLCHQNADPDAICSAFAFSRLIKTLNQNTKVDIACPDGISKLSKVLSKYLPMEIMTEEPLFEDADIIVMLDTNTIRQLGKWSEKVKGSSAYLILIDHHASHPETEKVVSLCISDEKSSSTCEIVYGFYGELGLNFSKEEAEALFLGIAFDTKHFILANSATFKIIADLVSVGVNAQESLSRLSLPIDLSERIARLKASRRMKLLRINNWLIAFSHVRSFQASAARAIVEMGAHLAVVGGQKDDQLQISIRSDQEFYAQTGFHVGKDLAKPLGEFLHGMGGGHSTAAGINGTGDFESAVKRAIKILRAGLVKNQNSKK